METYRFVNIFETKGLEYLLLICFLGLFILLVRYLTPRSRRSARADSARAVANREDSRGHARSE